MSRAGLAAVAVIAGCLFATGAAADLRHGLDQRPSNATCLAGPMPTDGLGATFVPAFAPPGGAALAFDRPIALDHAPTRPRRWYVAERGGRIKTFTDDFSPARVALDIRGKMQFTSMDGNADSQQAGITAIALHPSFASNGYIYVAYNRRPAAGQPVVSYVSRFTANADRTAFAPASEQIVLQLKQMLDQTGRSAPWHHLGQIQFGRDGFLYVGFGDGSIILPHPSSMRAQDPHRWLGKILRIDVNRRAGGRNYAIPADNPYANGVNGAPEVYALGFRNPWRFSFDRLTGELWVSDAGQNEREEVNKVVKGKNYGWPIYEGTLCTRAACNPAGFEMPVHEFGHDVGPTIIGGYVYRGSRLASLEGTYVFGAGGVPPIWSLDPTDRFARKEVGRLPFSGAHTFGEDLDGELYVLNSSANRIVKMVPRSGGGIASIAPRLSRTGCFASVKPLRYAAGVIPYDINSPLWSDGAGKARAMAVPDGKTISVDGAGDFFFPAGTVLIKTFSYGDRPHETRLFMRHDNGLWRGYTYLWRGDLSDADLVDASGTTKVVPGFGGRPVNWRFPSQAQCAMCHTAAAGSSLGPEIAQLNRDFTYPNGRTSNQLTTLDHIGMFERPIGPANRLPALAGRWPLNTSVIRRARSYLHANCSNCHRPGGPAQAAIDLRSRVTTSGMKMCNEPPLTSDLGVAGARLLSPGEPEKSIFHLRMTRRSADQMPPLATELVDSFIAKNAIRPWINRADVCVNAPDSDADGVPDNADNCVPPAGATSTAFWYNPDQADDDRDGYGNACDGDVNNDGVVNATDRGQVASRLGTLRNQPGFLLRLDLNHDLIINAADLAIVAAQMGRAPGPSALKR